MKILKDNFITALISTILIGTTIIYISFLFYKTKYIIGPLLIFSGFIPWIPLKLSGRRIRETGADIVFGMIDTGILGIGALFGAKFAGVVGAILGGVVGDAITDALAGLFEGKMAVFLRNHGINEARTPLSSSMGKMSGCLLGIGITLTIAWTVFSF